MLAGGVSPIKETYKFWLLVMQMLASEYVIVTEGEQYQDSPVEGFTCTSSIGRHQLFSEVTKFSECLLLVRACICCYHKILPFKI